MRTSQEMFAQPRIAANRRDGWEILSRDCLSMALPRGVCLNPSGSVTRHVFGGGSSPNTALAAVPELGPGRLCALVWKTAPSPSTGYDTQAQRGQQPRVDPGLASPRYNNPAGWRAGVSASRAARATAAPREPGWNELQPQLPTLLRVGLAPHTTYKIRKSSCRRATR